MSVKWVYILIFNALFSEEENLLKIAKYRYFAEKKLHHVHGHESSALESRYWARRLPFFDLKNQKECDNDFDNHAQRLMWFDKRKNQGLKALWKADKIGNILRSKKE